MTSWTEASRPSLITYTEVTEPGARLLQEDGFFILQEDGSSLLLESRGTDWSEVTRVS